MRPLHLLLAVGVAAVWGFNFIFVKLGLNQLPPFLLCALRFFLVSIPVVFFIPRPPIPLKQLSIYGLINFALQFSLLFWGMQENMPAGLSAIILQLQMVLSLIFAAIFLKERVTGLQIIGALIAFSGLSLVWMNLNHTPSYLGFLLEIGGATCLAVGNLLTRQIGAVNPFALVAWGCLIATPPMALVSYWIEGPQHIISALQHISVLSILAVCYITYVSTWFGYGAWSWLLGKYRVLTIIPFTLLTPVFGMIGAHFVFNEPLERWKLHAGLLILSGLSVQIFGPQLFTLLRRKSVEPLSDDSITET